MLITLKQGETDNINRMLTKNDSFYSIYYNIKQTGPSMKSDHFKRQITLTVITLSDFCCIYLN